MKKIYLAGPFSHTDKKVMDYRAHELAKAAGYLLKKGYLVYSPITHSKPIVDVYPLFPKTFEFWRPLDESMIMDWADEVWVLALDGWQNSIGVQAEVELAQSLNMKTKLLVFSHFSPNSYNNGEWEAFTRDILPIEKVISFSVSSETKDV